MIMPTHWTMQSSEIFKMSRTRTKSEGPRTRIRTTCKMVFEDKDFLKNNTVNKFENFNI